MNRGGWERDYSQLRQSQRRMFRHNASSSPPPQPAAEGAAAPSEGSRGRAIVALLAGELPTSAGPVWHHHHPWSFGCYCRSRRLTCFVVWWSSSAGAILERGSGALPSAQARAGLSDPRGARGGAAVARSHPLDALLLHGKVGGSLVVHAWLKPQGGSRKSRLVIAFGSVTPHLSLSRLVRRILCQLRP
jgi:hypothetical protein